jgi:light-regulated signal transduction histidine kinase (bacteriophytochrome)
MVLNLRDENTLDELLETMKSQYVGLMSEARDYGMTYPSYKVEEFNTIGDMAQNGILNLLAFAEQHKPELAGKLKSLVNDVTEVIYDDMEEFDTQPRISVKKKLDEKVKAKLVKGLEKNKKDIKEHVELLSEEKDEEKIQTHKTRLQELLDARKKAEKLLEQEEEDAPIDKQMDKFKFTQQQQTLLKSAIQNQPTKFREVLLNLMQQVDDLTQGDESNNSVVKSAIAVLGRGL